MTRLFALLFVLSSSLAANAASEKVEFDAHSYKRGTIIVNTGARELYYVLSDSEALRYSVGVGKKYMQWIGRHTVDGMYENPPWQAPWDKNAPVIPGGSPKNPMGAGALTLRDTNYAIHGTNEPQSIGQFVSHGCIRMLNEDIRELFTKVTKNKTEVIVQP